MADGDQNLYGVYENSLPDQYIHICRYYYDAELSTKQRKHCRYTDFMRVGMAEAAVRAFEKEHPEVDVDYQYALGQGQTEIRQTILMR